jgi:hypothetical protein
LSIDDDDFFSDDPPPEDPKATKERALAAYIARGNPKVGEVVYRHPKGEYVVKAIRPDGSIAWAHHVKPGLGGIITPKKRPASQRPDDAETVEDIIAYALKATGGGKDVVDGFISLSKDKSLSDKDRMWALERLRVMVAKGSEKAGPTRKPGSEIILPPGLPELTCAQLADLHAFCRDHLGFDADRVRVDGAGAAPPDPAQPAPAVPEAGDFSIPE